MAIPRNLANLANQLDTSGNPPKVQVGDSSVVVTDTGSNGTIVFNTDNAERMRITAAGNVGIGTTSPTGDYFGDRILQITGSTSAAIKFERTSATARKWEIGCTTGGALDFADTVASTSSPRMRLTNDGYFCLGKTDTSNTTNGLWISAASTGDNFQSFFVTTRADGGASPIYVNRQSSDGTLIQFQQANTDEGSISVSGNTVSYNAFAGSHWSQFQQGRGYNPEVPRGTVLSTIGEMCEWKSVEWAETIEHEATEDKEAWTETIPRRETYLGNLAVGATFEEDGVTKTVVDDGNERLPKVKISDVAGDKAVYGVFQTYDSAQDLLVTSLGAFVVRIAAGVTVQIGDLLESNGDGCAKVQDDDIIRSKTIGKVTSTTATATYDDGSYTVPCVLYCG